MNKILSLLMMALMTLSVMPLALAEEDDVTGGIDIDVDADNDPIIYTDHTQRSWYPNDQTYYTAEEYGTADTNRYGDDFYEVPARGDYVFSGETITYYVVVEDEDNNLDTVELEIDNGLGFNSAGFCSEISYADLPWVNGGVLPEYMTPTGALVYDDATMNTYRCVLVIQDAWTSTATAPSIIRVLATDDDGNDDGSDPQDWTDSLVMNPTLNLLLDLINGPIDFGTGITPGSIVTSNTVYLRNTGSDGVVMDMYIASDDYFTDPFGGAICGISNGIKYDQFSYYATKGSIDSGNNDNSYFGLGETNGCAADADEFTELPSHSGNIDDMCRIINHAEQASFLGSGQSMSLTFQLDVPTPCRGRFTDGDFHFVGRVV